MLDAWRRSDTDALLERLAPTLTESRQRIAVGLPLRRVKVISELPSEYMRSAPLAPGPGFPPLTPDPAP